MFLLIQLSAKSWVNGENFDIGKPDHESRVIRRDIFFLSASLIYPADAVLFFRNEIPIRLG